jgi:hypothetical protein
VGEAWEKLAQPDWAHFFDQSDDEETGELTSHDLTLIMARTGWFPELAGQQIKAESVNVEEFTDYEILYWKRLPHVYHATFSCVLAEARWAGGWIGEPKWFRDWWHATTTWYKKPWELEGWPSH